MANKYDVYKIDNSIIKNRNLMRGTSDFTINSDWWNLRGTRSDNFFGDLRIAQSSLAWTSPGYKANNLQVRSLIELNTPYTFSSWVRNTSNTDTIVAFYGDDSYIIRATGYHDNLLTAHSDWTRVSITFNFTKIVDKELILRFESQKTVINGVIQFAGYKLEKGTLATDWTPAPEDLQGKVLTTIEGELDEQNYTPIMATGLTPNTKYNLGVVHAGDSILKVTYLPEFITNKSI